MGRAHGGCAQLLSLRAPVVLAVLLAAAPVAAGDAAGRLAALLASDEAAAEALMARCGREARCVAAGVADQLGSGAHLVRAPVPDTDTIRWAETRPSIEVDVGDDVVRVEIRRFGRKVAPGLAAALATLPSDRPLVIDLRANAGGSFNRMLDVAGLLLGAHAGAIRLVSAAGTTWRDVPSASDQVVPVRTVVIGAGTASAAEVLAALLVVHGGARLCGDAPSAGEASLKSVIPVDHDWRLLVERARIDVPPLDLEGGLRPAGPC